MRGKPNQPLGEAWGTGSLTLAGDAGRSLVNVFTGEKITVREDATLSLSEVFAKFPVAILRSE
jgi:maltooligosyltrehalose synthase